MCTWKAAIHLCSLTRSSLSIISEKKKEISAWYSLYLLCSSVVLLCCLVIAHLFILNRYTSLMPSWMQLNTCSLTFYENLRNWKQKNDLLIFPEKFITLITITISMPFSTTLYTMSDCKSKYKWCLPCFLHFLTFPVSYSICLKIFGFSVVSIINKLNSIVHLQFLYMFLMYKNF